MVRCGGSWSVFCPWFCYFLKYEVGKPPDSGLGTWLGIGNVCLKVWVGAPSPGSAPFGDGPSVNLSGVEQSPMGAFGRWQSAKGSALF